MQTISELERALQFLKKKDRVDTLLQLSALYMDSDLQKAVLHARNAKKLARKLKMEKEEAEADRRISETLFLTVRYGKAIEALENSLFLTRKIKDEKGLSATLIKLAENYYRLNEYDKSVEYNFAALNLAEKQDDLMQQADIMNNLALIYILMKDYNAAAEYLNKVIKIWKQKDYKAGIFNATLNLSVLAFEQQQLDEARVLAAEALKIAEEIGKEDYLAAASNSLGLLLIKQDKYEKALDLFLEFIDILQDNEQGIWVLADLLNNIATCYLRLRDHEQANEYASRSIKIAREIDAKSLIVRNLEIIIELSLEEEDYKNAYESANELHELKQRISEKIVAARIAEVRLRSKVKPKSRDTVDTGSSGDQSALPADILDTRIKEIIADQEQYKLMIKSSEAIFTLHDRKGKYLYCNRPFLTLKLEDIIGKTPYNFYKFEYADELVRQIKYTFSSGKSGNIYCPVNIDGEEKWLSHYIYPVYDQDGNIISVAILSRYQSQRKQQVRKEEPSPDTALLKQLDALKEEQIYWKSFREDVSRFATFRIELHDDAPVKQQAVLYSSSLSDILGITVTEDFAKWFRNIHSDEKEKLVATFRDSVEQGEYLNEQIRLYHPEKNQYRWINLILDPGKKVKGKVEFFNGVITDITSQKQQEIELSQELEDRKLGKEILRKTLQPFVLIKPEGKIIEGNSAFSELIGYDPQKITTLNWKTDLTTAESQSVEEKACQALQKTGKAQKFEQELIHQKGNKLNIVVNAHPLLHETGKIELLCYFINDITLQKEFLHSLKSSHQELKELIQQIPDILLEMDKKGVIRKFTLNSLAQSLDLTAAITGKKPEEIFSDETSEKILSALSEYRKRGKSDKFQFKKDNYFLEGQILAGNQKSQLFIIRDITEQRQREAQIIEKFHNKEQEYLEQLQSIDNNLNNLKSIVIEPGLFSTFRLSVNSGKKESVKVIQCSPSLQDITGVSDIDKFENWFITAVDEDNVKLNSALKSVIDSGKSIDITIQLLDEVFKEKRWLRVIAEPVKIEAQVKYINGAVFDVTDDKLRESKLQEKLGQIETNAKILQEFSQPFAICDATGKFISVNKSFCDLTGYSFKELQRKKTWQDLWLNKTEKLFKLANFISGESLTVEKKIQTRNQQLLSLNIILHPHFTASDTITEVYCFAFDVSDRINEFRDLEISYSNLNKALKILPEDIVLLDSTGKILQIVNIPANSDFPLKIEDKDKNISDLLPEDTGTEILSALQKSLKRKTTVELEYSILINSQVKWFKGEIKNISSDKAYLLIREITELVEIKDKLCETREKLDNFHQQSLIALITLDSQLNFLEVNPAAEKLLGYERAELQKMNLQDLASNDKELISSYKQVLKGKEMAGQQQQILPAGQKDELTILSYSCPLKNSDGKIDMIQSFWIDVSTRKLTEEDLKLQEKDLDRRVEEQVEEIRFELAQLQSLVQNAEHHALFRLALIGKKSQEPEVVFASPALKKLLKINDPSSFRNWSANLLKEDGAILSENINFSITEERSVVFRIRVLSKDETSLNWLQISLDAVKGSKGKITYLNGVMFDITELKNNENALLEDLQQLKETSLMMHELSLPCAISDFSGKLLKVNAAFCELTGYKEKELLKADNWQYILTTEEGLEQEGEILQQMIKLKSHQRYHKKLTRVNGEKIDIEQVIVPYPDEEQQKYLIFAYDNSDTIEVIRTLQESERDLLRISANLPENILELDPNGKIKTVLSFTATDKFINNENLEGKKIHNLYAKKAAENVLSSLQECLKNKKNINFRFSTEIEETSYWYSAEMIYKDKNSVIFVTEEITNSVELERKYHEVLENFENSIEKCPLPYLRFDVDLNFQYLNQAALMLLNIVEKDLNKLVLADFDTEERELVESLKQVLQDKKLISFEQEIYNAQKKKINILHYAYPFLNEQGEIKGINSFWVNITDRELIDQELKIKTLDLEKTVDTKITKLALDLSEYKAFIEGLKDFGVFRTGLTDADTNQAKLEFHNEVLFNLLETDKTADLKTLFRNLPAELSQKIFAELQTNTTDTKIVNEVFKLAGKNGSSKFIKLYLTCSPVKSNQKSYINGIVFDVTDQITKETELSSQLKLIAGFEKMISDSAQPFVSVSKDMKLINYNTAFQKLTGYNKEEMTALNWSKTIPSATELEKEETYFNEVLNKSKPVSYQRELITKDGKNIFVEINAHCPKTQSDQEEEFYLFINDLSEQKNLLQMLEQKEIEFDRFLQKIPFTILTIDKQNNIKQVVSASLSEIPLFSEELTGKNLNSVFSDNDLTYIEQGLSECRKSGSNSKLELKISSNNKIFWLQTEIVFLDQENTMLVIEDITKFKEREKFAAENQLRNYFAAIPSATYAYSPDFTLTYMSKGFRKMLQIPDEAKDIKWSDLLAKNSQNKIILEMAEKAIKTGIPAPSNRIELENSDGLLFPVEVREAPVLKDGKTVSMAGVLRDLSQLENSIAQNQFLSGSLHSINSAILVTDPEFKILFANHKSADLLELKADKEFLNEDLMGLLNDHNQKQMKKIFQDHSVEEKDWQQEIELIRSDESLIRKNLHVSTFTVGKAEKFRVLCFQDAFDSRDITAQLELIREELNRKQENEIQLLQQQKKLEDLINISGIGVWEWDIDSNKLQCSDGFFRIMGFLEGQKAEMNFGIELFKDLIHPDSEVEFSDFLKKVKQGDKELELDLKILDMKNVEKMVKLRAQTYFQQNKPIHLLGIVYDLSYYKIETSETEKLAATEIPDALSKENDTALEDHLKVITYLIEENPDFSSQIQNQIQLNEIQERAEVISIMLRLAINSQEDNIIHFQKYLQLLSQTIGKKIGSKKLVSMRINAKDIKLPLEKAIPCGLIIHELVANSIKYAFPRKRKSFYENTIKIDLIKETDKYILTVSDNGIGFPKDFDFEKSSAVGLKLVRLWTVQQLKGSFNINLQQKIGTSFNIIFD